MAQVILLQRKYGAGFTLPFMLVYQNSSVGSFTFEAGDSAISKASSAMANTTNLPTAVTGADGLYSVLLTDAEMQATTISLKFEDVSIPTSFDVVHVFIDTYGDAAAMHQFDISVDQPTVSLGEQGLENAYNMSTSANSAIGLNNLVADTSGMPADPSIGTYLDKIMNKDSGQTFSQATDSLEAFSVSGSAGAPSVQSIVDGVWSQDTSAQQDAGTRGKEASDSKTDNTAILVDTVNILSTVPTSAENAAATLSAVSSANNSPNTIGALINDVSTVDSNVSLVLSDSNAILVDTNEMQGKLPSGTISSFNPSVSAVNLNPSQSGVTVGTVNSVVDLGTTARSRVNTEVNDVLDTAQTAMTSIPADNTATLKQMLQFTYSYWRNRRSQTPTVRTVYQEDGTSTLATGTISESGSGGSAIIDVGELG